MEPGPGGDAFALTWTERGGPSVTSPERRGFGAGAEVSVAFEPAGVVARLRASLDVLQSGIAAG